MPLLESFVICYKCSLLYFVFKKGTERLLPSVSCCEIKNTGVAKY